MAEATAASLCDRSAAMGTAFYFLYFRRTPLPPAAPHALVAPSIASLPGLSACWIETGKTFSSFSFGSTAGSILVRHPAGDLLIDTGNSSHFDDEIRGYPFATWFKLRFLAGQLKPDVPLSELLRRVKEDPCKIALGDSFSRASRSFRRADGLAATCRSCSRRKNRSSPPTRRASKRFRHCRARAKISCARRTYFALRSSALRNLRRKRRPI